MTCDDKFKGKVWLQTFNVSNFLKKNHDIKYKERCFPLKCIPCVKIYKIFGFCRSKKYMDGGLKLKAFS